MSGAIPRFLLPQRSALWRSRIKFPQPTTMRTASQKAPPAPGPKVLEKPSKFNPPSHGSRPKSSRPKTYGAPLSEEQVHTQQTKQYPNMMPPDGSFMHWFITSRSIHVWITMSTLMSLAAYTSIEHFRQTSPVADLLPPASDLFYHPITFFRSVMGVYRLHVETKAAETYDRRFQRVLDVGKRSEFRKTHGLPGQDTLFGWTARTDAETLGTSIMTGDNIPPQPGQIVRANWKEGGDTAAEVEAVRKKAPKWFGIW